MEIYILTDENGKVIEVFGRRETAVKTADFYELSGEYPVDSLYVDEYTVIE